MTFLDCCCGERWQCGVQRARTREVDAWASWLRGLKIAAARLNSERRRVQGLKDGDGETTPELGSLVSASGLWRSREESGQRCFVKLGMRFTGLCWRRWLLYDGGVTEWI
ncbi:hypothetical protein M0R45_000804 [Rubus argutus]|uniref:Uncharacterized protein n=1 Tax=Rubus argutus TaxID=59490 RepID=A0AAW1VMA8_RUBAR